MRARPHRFLQYLKRQGATTQWCEIPAIAGGFAGSARASTSIRFHAPGRATREIKAGIAWVLKWLARLLYLSPLFIALRCGVASAMDRPSGDAVTVAYVCLVVAFFVLLNVYIVWSVVAHFRGRGSFELELPFSESGADQTGLFEQGAAPSSPGEIIRARGVVQNIGAFLPGGTDLLRDAWAVESENPWRIVEALDFAVVTDDERPLIVKLGSAPNVVAPPVKEMVHSALSRLSSGINSIFDMGPALSDGRGEAPAYSLSLTEGQEVEIIGTVSGGVPNVSRFELGSRVCTLDVGGHQRLDPYRGASGGEGVILEATPDTPIWIRRLRRGLHAL
jgi:hypothetical protein